MKHLLISSISQIEKFLNSNREFQVRMEIESQKKKYLFISNTLFKFKYKQLDKKDKHIVLRYLKFFTGYSLSHLKRLANKWRTGFLYFNPSRDRNKFSVKYGPTAIALLIKTDIVHKCLSGEATRRILKREYEIFRRQEYKIISSISASHIYNIRNHNRQYNSSQARFFKRTQATQVNIGIRRKPAPNGKSGYLRVDTVHQGDFNGQKGVYHVNIVDEITQYEMIGTVPKITEHYLKPVVEELLNLFPFVIHEFHADNGSEFINYVTAKLLNKLHIQLSKSRSRHSNDNALVESKNGSIVRKIYGRNYIDQKWAKTIDKFNRKYVNFYLNYHRPCGFASDYTDSKGKIKKKYKTWMTPYEKFKSLKNAEQYLKPNFDFKELDKLAYEKSDNQFAEGMNNAKTKLFRLIQKG